MLADRTVQHVQAGVEASVSHSSSVDPDKCSHYIKKMDAKAKRLFICEKARQNTQDSAGTRVMWSRHAIAELVMDRLTRESVEQALQACEVLEDYPSVHRPLPDCLVLGWLAHNEPLHAVVAIDLDQDRILLVTIYRPNQEEWEHDWRTRKK